MRTSLKKSPYFGNPAVHQTQTIRRTPFLEQLSSKGIQHHTHSSVYAKSAQTVKLAEGAKSRFKIQEIQKSFYQFGIICSGRKMTSSESSSGNQGLAGHFGATFWRDSVQHGKNHW